MAFNTRLRQIRQQEKFRESLFGYLFVAPTALILGIFLILPIFYAIFLSLHRVRILGEVSYRLVWFRNFIRLFDDSRVWIALQNTAEYVAVVVPTQTLLIYQYAFKSLDLGYASALALVLAAVILGATLVQRRFFQE